MNSRLRAYIAGPISKGDLAHNVNQATAAFVVLAKAGLAPFCPHWSVYAKTCHHYVQPDKVYCVGTRNGNQEMSHGDWLGVDLAWVEVADCVLRLPGESAGADTEVEHARNNNIPVFDSVEAVVAWAEENPPY